MRGTSSKLWKGERKGPKFREVEERVLVCCHRKLIENVKNWIPRIEQSYHIYVDIRSRRAARFSSGEKMEGALQIQEGDRPPPQTPFPFL